MITNNLKRKYSFSEKDDRMVKKPHAECTYDLENESNQEIAVKFDNTYENNESKSYFVYQLSRLIYRFDLSILCLVRKLVHEKKYHFLSVTVNNNEINKFNDIGIHYDTKSICIKVENIDIYIKNSITYTKLFGKRNQSFSINNYFNNFVKYTFSLPNDLTSNVEHLIIYTNSTLDLTDENSLKWTRGKNFYPFQFESMNTGKCRIIKDFLYISNHQNSKIYRFSQDQHTKTEFLKRLEFSSVVQKLLKEKKISSIEDEKQIKEEFFKKLIFFVNQPHREKLKNTVKNELGKFHHNYVEMYDSILNDLMASKSFKSSIMYEFTVLISIMHDMLQYKKISSVNIKSTDISNMISLCYKQKMTYIAVHDVSSQIGYTQLFPSKQNKNNNLFCINKMYAFYAQQLNKNENIKFCIFYTNTHLSLTKKKKLKEDGSKEFFPIKFNKVDVQKKRFKLLRDLLCINNCVAYQFASEESTLKYIINLLELPCLLKSNLDINSERQIEIKKNFLHKLVFVCEQPNVIGLNSILLDHINKSNTFYDFEQLSELALRWPESHRSVPATERLMKKLLDKIQNNRPSYQKIKKKYIIEEIKLTKSVVHREETTLVFIQFLDYITIGQGRKYLQVMKNHGIELKNLSNLLHNTGGHAISTLEELYNLWFDNHGHETKYLKNINKYGIKVASIGSILRGSAIQAANAFKNLYYLWFDEDGNQKLFLKTLEGQNIKLSTMSSILGGAGVNASRAFKDLYDFWFDDQGNKTRYLKNFENNGVGLFRMSSILHHSGKDAAKTFKELHDLWFDEEGKKTKYLKTLKENEVNLVNFSNMLNGTGPNVTLTFKNLYNLWFCKNDEKSQYLKTLENNKVDLTIMSNILRGSRLKAVDAFKKLYYFWFDENGNKTQYLNNLEKEGIDLRTMCKIVSGAGFNAPKVLKDLHDLWFYKNGSITQYLKILKGHRINLTSFFDILYGSGSKAVRNFIELYNLVIDNEGKKTRYLQCLEDNNITIVEIAKILSGAGSYASTSLKNLCNLWFDKNGEKMEYVKICEKNYMTLNDVCNALKRTRRNASTKFKDLCRSF